MAERPASEKPSAAQLALAHALADAAGEITRRYFRRKLAVEDKSDRTPVTIADREAEAAMRQRITAAFPDHGIIGEETGTSNEGAEWSWVIDPIDGTRSFISGIPLFGTLIALTHRRQPVLGIIDQPVLRERWVGVLGEATTFNGAPTQSRRCAGLDAATLFTTAPELFSGAEARAFARLRRVVKLVRYGADCYAYAQLASGFVDLVVEAGLKPYDYCALVPVIAGAGGVIGDWQGGALDLDSKGQVLAAGDPALAAAARALLVRG